MARRAKTVDLLRVVDVLQEHITPALCRTVFGTVRTTERRRVWTLEALIQFWTAVVLRPPKAFSQALPDSLEGRDPICPKVEASPEAFFQRCRDLRPATLQVEHRSDHRRQRRFCPARQHWKCVHSRARRSAIHKVILAAMGLRALGILSL